MYIRAYVGVYRPFLMDFAFCVQIRIWEMHCWFIMALSDKTTDYSRTEMGFICTNWRFYASFDTCILCWHVTSFVIANGNLLLSSPLFKRVQKGLKKNDDISFWKSARSLKFTKTSFVYNSWRSVKNLMTAALLSKQWSVTCCFLSFLQQNQCLMYQTMAKLDLKV